MTLFGVSMSRSQIQRERVGELSILCDGINVEHTQCAVHNFTSRRWIMPKSFTRALLLLKLFATKIYLDFTAHKRDFNQAYGTKSILVVSLNPVMNYTKDAKFPRKFYWKNRSVVDVPKHKINLTHPELKNLLNPMRLTNGGI